MDHLEVCSHCAQNFTPEDNQLSTRLEDLTSVDYWLPQTPIYRMKAHYLVKCPHCGEVQVSSLLRRWGLTYQQYQILILLLMFGLLVYAILFT